MTHIIKKILIVGGDNRQIYLSEALNNRGFEAKIHTDGDLVAELKNTDAVILPMPFTKDGVTVNSQNNPVEIKDLLNGLTENNTVFVGLAGNSSVDFNNNLKVYDYSKREELAIKNAVPTAEGVIKIAIERMNTTVFSSKVLITGFGKTAKAVAKAFYSLGADVTICARKASDLAYAESLCYETVNFTDLNERCNNYDILINTVPSIVITETTLMTLPQSCLLIEIASAPYGIDFSAARDAGFESVVSGSLPGKIAPKTAGYIICEAICNIMKEENL